MPESFQYDVFLSHSSKDKAIVRPLAERLRKDGIRVWFDEWEIHPGDSIPSKIEKGLEQSHVLVFCMSEHAFGSDWATLESQTFRFRDPLNKELRFIPLRLDDAPIKGSLVQFLYVNWLPQTRGQEYSRLLESCRPPEKRPGAEVEIPQPQVREKSTPPDYERNGIRAYAFDPGGKDVLCAADDHTVRLWNVETGQCLRVFEGHTNKVTSVAWSSSRHTFLSGSFDKTLRLWDLETARCLQVFEGHAGNIWSLDLNTEHKRVLSGSEDNTVRLWDLGTGRCLRVLKGHSRIVWGVALAADLRRALSCSFDETVRLWSLETGRCLRVFEGHTDKVRSVAWSADHRRALSCSDDETVRLWDVETGRCLRVLEGHTTWVLRLAWNPNQRYALSSSSGRDDATVRLWDLEKGICLRVLEGHRDLVNGVAWSADGRHAFSGDQSGGIRTWDLSDLITDEAALDNPMADLGAAADQVQYTNAKVLLVGDTSAGKTGLAHRLATGAWKPSDSSTVGAWSTQWKLKDNTGANTGVEREIWLWDFGGQADQRLIHQLYMDRAALILLLFNADQEDVLPGLRDWQTALRRCVPPETPQLLVAGRIDAGFKASRGKLQNFARGHQLAYYETSALDGTGCKELRAAIMAGIAWANIPVTSTEHLFKLIKDEILKLRDEGQVLHTFKELRELLWRRLSPESRCTDEILHTVIGLLDGPGAVKELDYGSYILLQPEWINAYAQAVIRTLRSSETELGYLPQRSIAEGKLVYQSVGRDGAVVDMKRLQPHEERIILGEMERQLTERGLCLQQGDKLVFPSHCGRDRPAVVKHPSVLVSYTVTGYLDDIYATLVVKLADSHSFSLKELWRDAADFDTLEGSHRMGIKLARETASSGDISVYFGPGVTQEEQVIFANYIHAHLAERSEQVQRLRYYVCPKCYTPKGNPQVLMEKLLLKKQQADTECDKCGKRFVLWDALEKKFASKAVRDAVEGLQAEDIIRLDSRRKGKLLALEVAARITSADQKCFEIPGTEDEGLDIELEFTDDDGKGTGKRLYLQLKAGNSYLRKRKTDGVEIFQIKKQRWVQYWLKQPHPVMLVVGTFDEDKERLFFEDKVEFADVRWMEISSILKHDSENGKKAVKQIEFKGERLDLTSVRRLRDEVLGKGLPAAAGSN
jgi:WD40 repeat protein